MLIKGKVMDKLLENKITPQTMASLNLAFVGDSVYELLVREYLATRDSRRVGELNREKVSLVNCASQTKALEKILPLLSEEEEAVFKRGRNVNVNSVPKNSTLKEYHTATGLEALFGYLYLTDSISRIRELFNAIISANDE